MVGRHPGHRAASALDRDDTKRCWCGPIRRSTDTPPWRRRSAAGPRCRSPCAWTRTVKAAIAAIGEQAWTPIEYTDAVYDETTGNGSPGPRSPRSRSPRSAPERPAEQIPGRLVVRRIPDLNPSSDHGQGDPVRHLAFPRVLHHHRPRHRHRRQDPPRPRDHRAGPRRPQDSALAHLPSGRFNANAAWLVLAVIAFNLTRAAATLTGPALAKARTATIRRTLITVPARIASSARRLTLHLPRNWPWETAWNTLFNNLFRRHHPIIA